MIYPHCNDLTHCGFPSDKLVNVPGSRFILFVAAGESLFAEYEDNTRQGQVKLKIMEELQTATTFLFRGSL